MTAKSIVVLEVASDDAMAPAALANLIRRPADQPTDEVEALAAWVSALTTQPTAMRLRVDSITRDQATATYAVTQANIAAGETISFLVPGAGTWTLTAVASGAVAADGEFNTATGNTETAASIAAAINAVAGLSTYFSATNSSGDLIVTAVPEGPVGNTYRVLDGTVNGISPAGGLLAGAEDVGERATATITIDDNAELSDGVDTNTIGTVVLTWATAAADQDEVTIGSDADESATNLAAAITAHTSLSGIVSAAAVDEVVTITYLGSAREGLLCRVAISDATAQTATAMVVSGALAAVASTRTYLSGVTG